MSVTVTVKEQVAVLPEASVAVQVTVVVPTGKQSPDGGVQLTVTPGQLSVAVAVKVSTAQHKPGSLVSVMLAGQVTVGGSVSLTVTMKEQLPPPVAEVQVTVVVPFAKAKPEGGEQVTRPQVPQAVGDE